MLTTKELIELIASRYLDTSKIADIFEYGRKRGWLEEQDILFLSIEIERRNAARIIHEFLRIERGFSEIRDWSNAKKLKDLYDCRVCAKHIANVVERGIMSGFENGRFMLLSKVTMEDINLEGMDENG